MKARDLTGQKFGKLTAIEVVRSDPICGKIWRCQCECGNYTEIPASRLINGITRSCGCLRREKKPRPPKDITGMKYGRLTPVRFDHYDDRRRAVWLFKCDCGNEVLLPATSVTNGKTTSCGCGKEAASTVSTAARKDLTGRKFGRLTPVEPTNKRDMQGAVIWKCKCDCGRTTFVSTAELESGRIKNCGCLPNRTDTEV